MYRMKLLTIVWLLLAFVATAAQAQGSTKRLVLWQKSGEKVYFDLNDLPETTFENGKLVIKTRNSSVQYLMENVLRYTFEGTGNTGVTLPPAERDVIISQEGDKVTLRNLQEGATVAVYTANGNLVEQRTAGGKQPFSLSLAQRPAGVYIVKAGSKTIKLMK